MCYVNVTFVSMDCLQFCGQFDMGAIKYDISGKREVQ